MGLGLRNSRPPAALQLYATQNAASRFADDQLLNSSCGSPSRSFVHVCDANCTFRELDRTAEGYVCQVSGR